METIIGWVEFVVAVLLILGFFLAKYLWKTFKNQTLPTYLDEKAKNLATKQDIEEITRKTEEVQKEFKEDFEKFSTDVHFKNEFAYKQYSELYCKLYAIVTQSEYVREYIRLTQGSNLSFDEVPFIEISQTERVTTRWTMENGQGKVSRTVEHKDTPISDFNKTTLCEYIIENGHLASPKLLKLAVAYRFANENMNSTATLAEGQSSIVSEHDAHERAMDEELRLIREITIVIVREYNKMRQLLQLDCNEREIVTGRIQLGSAEINDAQNAGRSAD